MLQFFTNVEAIDVWAFVARHGESVGLSLALPMS